MGDVPNQPVEEQLHHPAAFSSDRHHHFEPPADVAGLVSHERLAERGQLPPLTDKETAHLHAWRTFRDPLDQEYRGLYERDRLAQKHLGLELSAEEKIKLNSKLTFRHPEDEYCRALYERKLLADEHPGKYLDMKLTAEEDATLQQRFAAMRPNKWETIKD